MPSATLLSCKLFIFSFLYNRSLNPKTSHHMDSITLSTFLLYFGQSLKINSSECSSINQFSTLQSKLESILNFYYFSPLLSLTMEAFKIGCH